jgi:hypothetical protein
MAWKYQDIAEQAMLADALSSKSDLSDTDQSSSTFVAAVNELADVLLEMRHLFNVQHAAHKDDGVPWTPEYQSPEALERVNLSRRLDLRLTRFDRERVQLPLTRQLVGTFNWSNTILDQAIEEVKALIPSA